MHYPAFRWQLASINFNPKNNKDRPQAVFVVVSD
jgi:hypothetical protein